VPAPTSLAFRAWEYIPLTSGSLDRDYEAKRNTERWT
jgi:hypothetical protein